MRLSGQQIRLIHEALLDAYGSRSHLEMMVRFNLDERLDNISAADTQFELVFDLVMWAEGTGHLRELVEAAHAQAPNNVKLADIANTIQEIPDSELNAQPKSLLNTFFLSRTIAFTVSLISIMIALLAAITDLAQLQPVEVIQSISKALFDGGG